MSKRLQSCHLDFWDVVTEHSRRSRRTYPRCQVTGRRGTSVPLVPGSTSTDDPVSMDSPCPGGLGEDEPVLGTGPIFVLPISRGQTPPLSRSPRTLKVTPPPTTRGLRVTGLRHLFCRWCLRLRECPRTGLPGGISVAVGRRDLPRRKEDLPRRYPTPRTEGAEGHRSHYPSWGPQV